MVSGAVMGSAAAVWAVTIGAAAAAALAEWLHARRVRRAARLAFGRDGTPRFWTRAAPGIRVAAIVAVTWGLLTLARLDPTVVEEGPSEKTSQRVLIVVDVSPSMQVVDAGPELEKLSRARWAGVQVRSILDRLDMKETRLSVVAFYTGALPILTDTFDKQVVANLLDGLPMHMAFRPGGTDASAGIEMALGMAKPWARRSTTLVFIGDGDLERPPRIGDVPASIADTIVIGVGDTERTSVVGGHSSRQDAWTLKQLAARLGGHFHEGNRRHLPTSILDSLTMTAPNRRAPMRERDLALWAAGLGASSLALLGPSLLLLGVPLPYGVHGTPHLPPGDLMTHAARTDETNSDPRNGPRITLLDRVIRSKVAWTLWALVPVAALAWGFGPGQAAVDRDRASRLIEASRTAETIAESAQSAAHAAHRVALAARKRAEATRDPADLAQAQVAREAEDAAYTAAAGAWLAVAEPLSEAHDLLEGIGDARSHEVRVSRARALIRGGEVLEGVVELEAVIDGLALRDESHSELAEQARRELGTGLYFGARLLRHAGARAEDWGAVATAARRQFRYLAEAAQLDSRADATAGGGPARRFSSVRFDEHQFNLEMALDLEQASYEELLGKPLPKQCPGAGICENQCKSLASHCKGKKKAKRPPRRDSRGNSGGDNDFEEGW